MSITDWTCHVCGDTRPDDKISVYSQTFLYTDVHIRVQQNVRYCNDNPDCIEKAKHINWLDGVAHYEMVKEGESGG